MIDGPTGDLKNFDQTGSQHAFRSILRRLERLGQFHEPQAFGHMKASQVQCTETTIRSTYLQALTFDDGGGIVANRTWSVVDYYS